MGEGPPSAAAHPEGAVAHSAPRSVKRPRPVKSCTECRSRKLKCDRLSSCSQCQRSGRVCQYSCDRDGADGADGASHSETGEPPLKRPHRASVARDVRARTERSDGRPAEEESPSVEPRPPRRRHGHRAVAPAVTIRDLSVKGGLRTRYFGQNSTKVLLNLFSDAKDFMHNMAKTESASGLFLSLQDVYRALQRDHEKILEPITVFVDSIMPVQKRMKDILPQKPVCDRLLETYIHVSEPFYRVIHVPTFLREYERYWENKGCYEAFLPLLLCMLSVGARFEAGSRGMGHDRSNGVHVPTACALVRSWLNGLREKQLMEISTLQAEVLLLHAKKNMGPRQQETWAQMGCVVRIAMAMGLHRDPSEFPQISPFHAENRRRLWYTIMDVDLHASLVCNLPASVRNGEYTCQPPRNIDDDDLYPDMTELPPSRPFDHFTNTLLHAYAAKTMASRLRIATIVSRLDSVRDYDEVLEVGTKLERLLDDINCLFPRHHALDSHRKIQEWRTRVILDLHLRRPLLALYRPFAMGAAACPAQISTSYLKSSMVMLTYIDELDHTLPGFQDVKHMYQLVLKNEIIQAAFSVCYYIKIAPDNQINHPAANSPVNHTPNNHTNNHTNNHANNNHLTPPAKSVAPGHWTPRESPGPSESSSADSSELQPIWSAATLTSRVEKTLENFISQIQDPVSDLRDLVALSIVLSSVQPGTPEEKFDRVTAGIRRVLESCPQSASAKADASISSSLPITPAAPTPADWHSGSEPCINPIGHANPLPPSDFFSSSKVLDDSYFWDNFLDPWNLVFVPMDRT